LGVRSFNANTSHQELLDLADLAARRVRGVMSGDFRAPGTVGMSGKRIGQYSLDINADNAACEVLRDAGVAIFSEESGFDSIDWPIVDQSIVAIIDPVDGSTNAHRGIPWYATSIAFVDSVGLRAAFVRNLATNETYTAIRDRGAYRDGIRIRTQGMRHPRESIVGVSGSRERSHGWWQYRALGAAALDLCLVATGMLDGWVDFDSHAVWDYAAAMLIIKEARGHVFEMQGQSLIHNDFDGRRTLVAAGNKDLALDLLRMRQGLEPR
jgi:fructose-1,6-bisphosphatase/inositol monophosphatase family enzyme